MKAYVLFLYQSIVVSILATFPHSCQPHGVALLGIIFQNILHFEKIYLSHASLVLSFACSPSLFHSASYKRTHIHTATCTQPDMHSPS